MDRNWLVTMQNVCPQAVEYPIYKGKIHPTTTLLSYD